MSDVVRNQRGAGLLSGIVSFIFGAITLLLVFRLVFRLFNANAANDIVSWIYQVSEPLVRPFFGIFQTDIDVTTGEFELETLLAIVVYALIGGLLMRLFGGRREVV